MIETPPVTVIVLSWNGERFLKPCLEAVLDQNYPALELIVVDNASTDHSTAMVQAYQPRVRLMQTDHNLGFAGGNNVGLRVASGEVVVLLNQDTEVQPGWLAALVEAFADPAIGIVGCKALYPDGRTIQHAGAFVDQPGAYPHHRGAGEEDQGQYDAFDDADYVTGAAFAIRRQTLQHLGELDDGYVPAYYEEVDYCYRARRAGYRVTYQPKAVLYHSEAASLHDQRRLHALAVHRNRLRFTLHHWTATQLEALWQAEQRSLEANQDPALLEILSRAYFENAVLFPAIAVRRETDELLGGRLTADQQRQALEKLMALARLAGQRMLAWTVVPTEATPQSETRAQDGSPWSEWLTSRPEPFFANNPAPASRVPLVGPLIFWLRSLWFTHMVRPYLAPVLGRLILSLEYLQQQNQALQRQMEARDLALLNVLQSWVPPSTRGK